MEFKPDFVDGQQSLDHEDPAQLAQIAAAGVNRKGVSEKLVRRGLEFAFAGVARIRNKELWFLDPEDAEEIVPELTAYINERASLADLTQKIADQEGVGLLALLVFRKAVEDFTLTRKEKKERKEQVKSVHPMPNVSQVQRVEVTKTDAPTDGIAGVFG